MNINILIDTASHVTRKISSAVKFNDLHCGKMRFSYRNGINSSFALQKQPPRVFRMCSASKFIKNETPAPVFSFRQSYNTKNKKL